MNIVITGGAGYIGSHVLKQLLENTSHAIVVIDNLSTGGHQTLETLQAIRPFVFFHCDLSNFEAIEHFFNTHTVETILHFAASIVVPESVQNPLKYYQNNTMNTTHLIATAIRHGVKKFIFSSTAAVYGEPLVLPKEGIDETFEPKPINPYGMSKLMSERILQDTAKAHPEFKYIIFRYFNVAGADSEVSIPRIGQSFPGATHLIKLASECVAGKREKLFIFGDDYPTHDGTCIRDYIHVDDLAIAHVDAIAYLDTHESDIFNIGYGKGYSVKEVLRTMQEVTCKPISSEVAPRRQGDPACLIADNRKIVSLMGWKPRFADLGVICKSAAAWEKVIDTRVEKQS